MAPAAIIILALVIYTGFTIPTSAMHPWFRWLGYLDPVAYAFEALMINEVGICGLLGRAVMLTEISSNIEEFPAPPTCRQATAMITFLLTKEYAPSRELMQAPTSLMETSTSLSISIITTLIYGGRSRICVARLDLSNHGRIETLAS